MFWGDLNLDRITWGQKNTFIHWGDLYGTSHNSLSDTLHANTGSIHRLSRLVGRVCGFDFLLCQLSAMENPKKP